MKKQLIDRDLVQSKICENTYNALKGLIDNSIYAQMITPNSRYKKNDIAYLKEFCTVRIGTARQSGHSTAMCRIISEYFNHAIILSPNENMSSRRCDLFRKVYAPPSQTFLRLNKNEISTHEGDMFLFESWNSNSLANIFSGTSIEAVFIDGTFDMSKNKENEIYLILGSCMGNNLQKLFVFIQ